MINSRVILLSVMFFNSLQVSAASVGPDINLEKYIPADILKIMPESTKNNYKQQIGRFQKEGDEGFVKYEVKEMLKESNWYTRAQEAAAGQQDEKARMDQAAQGKFKFNTEYLYNKPTQGSMTFNACTYAMLSDAEYIYNTLQAKRNISSHDLPAVACPKAWEQKAEGRLGQIEAIQPSNENIGNLVKDFNIFKHGNYTMIDNLTSIANLPFEQDALISMIDDENRTAKIPLLAKAINELKTKPMTTQIFLVSVNGHWFAVVGFKNNNMITFYISDRDRSKIEDYHRDTVRFLEKLIS